MSFVQNKYHAVYDFLKRYAVRQVVVGKDRHVMELMRLNDVSYSPLNSSQRKAVDEVYGKYKSFRTGGYSYRTHELCLAATGEFSPCIVPYDFFSCFVCPRMNSAIHTQAWRDKNLFDVYLPNGRFPEVIIKNIRGHFYDKNFRLLTMQEASDILKNAGKYIVKPTTKSGFGRGVMKTDSSLEVLLKKYGMDFIVQKPLVQHKELSELNESSVNVTRVMTLFIDDTPELLCAAIRIGNKGAIIDYSPDAKGRGNVICGLDREGRLAKFAFQPCGLKTTCSSNGTKFEGRRLPSFDKMVDMALSCHARMPYFRFIAWDMTIDCDGEPVIMEYNLLSPGIMYYQWTNGPLFGTDVNRIHYVIDKLTSSDI